MKKIKTTTVLLSLILVALTATTGYSLKLVTDFKKQSESQLAANKELEIDLKKVQSDIKKKDTDLTDQKKLIADLEKKNKELSKSSNTDGLLTPANEQTTTQTAQSPTTADRVATEGEAKVNSENEANQATIAAEEAKEAEPEYALFEGNPYRFALNHGITVEDLMSLNGKSDYSDFVSGESYRIK